MKTADFCQLMFFMERESGIRHKDRNKNKQSDKQFGDTFLTALSKIAN